MEPVKHMDIAEFQAAGYLQEANRQWFHPLGLALEVEVDGWTDPELVRKRLAHALGYEPRSDQLAAVIVFLEATSLDQPRISAVWDCRDDPEGMRYGDGDDWGGFPQAQRRVAWERSLRVTAEREAKVATRRAALGYDVQPLPLAGG